MKATRLARSFDRPPRSLTLLASAALALGLAACGGGKGGPGGPGSPDPEGGSEGDETFDGPALFALSPAAGAPSGGTLVEITGSGFAECAPGLITVRFGSDLASGVIVVSDAVLLATSPAGPAGESVSVWVLNDCGEAMLPGAFTYSSPNAPFDHDLDGDGRADFVIGAPGSDLGGDQAGAVFVFLGTAGPLAGTKQASQADVVLLGGAPGDRFGETLLTADLDGDGIADLLVGAPGASIAGEEAGALYVFFGPLPATALSAGDASITIPGPGPGARFGAAVAVGSRDELGRRRLLVGAPGASAAPSESPELPGVGAVYLFQDAAALETWQGVAASDVTIHGIHAGNNLGTTVAFADLTGDGAQELVLGAPAAGAQENGAVYVLRDGPTLVSGTAIDADATWSGAPGERLGAALAVADLDGDGIADLVVGAPGSSAVAPEAGRAYLILGSELLLADGPTQPAAVFSGHVQGGRFGSALALGDIAGNGHPELAIGAPHEGHAPGSRNGKVYIFRGGPGAPVDRVASSADAIYVGEVATGGEFGSSLGLADLDGDGRAQMIVGAPANSSAGPDAGRVYVFRAQPGLVPHLPASAALRITGAAAGDRFGTAVSR